MNTSFKPALGIGIALLLVSTTSLRAENELTALAERTGPSVVLLTAEDPIGNKLGAGTGFVVTKDGRVVTNHHVIEPASRMTATLADGSKRKILGILADDEENDIAILQMEGSDLPALTLGNSSQIKAGDEVVVIGSPMELAGTLTVGIVSAVRPKGVPVDDDHPNPRAHAWGIQISAAVSPGSSGSPIMKRDGEVVAVAVGAYLGGAQNLNFGVPIEIAKGMLAKLAPDAPVKPFFGGEKSDIGKNLLISAGVVGGLIALFLVWGWMDRRRVRQRPRKR